MIGDNFLFLVRNRISFSYRES